MPSLIRLDNGQTFKCKNGDILGRGADSHIFLDNDGVSRRHASIQLSDGRWEIVDLNSRNGLYINSRLVKRASLMPGDRIGIGNINLLFSDDDSGKTHSALASGTHSTQFGRKTMVLMRNAQLDFVEYAANEPILNAVSSELEGEWLRKLFLATIAINSAPTEIAVYEAINEAIQDNLTCTQIYIALFYESGENFALSTGSSDPSRMSADIMRRVLVHGHSVLVKNPLTAGLTDGENLIKHRVNTIVAAPLINSKSKPFGIVYIDSTEANVFHNDEFAFVRALCAQAGLHLATLLQQPRPINETKIVQAQLPGVSAYTNAIIERIKILASVASPILVIGEAGCDFSLITRSIHTNSTRGHIRLVTVNCADTDTRTPEELIFGNHDLKLPGRIRQAEKGTLILENIECLPLPVQQKLYHFILSSHLTAKDGHEEPYDTRLVFTTTTDPMIASQNGFISPDLLRMLSPSTLRLSRLADHREDLPALIDFYFDRLKQEVSRHQVKLSPAARAHLCHPSHLWRGNEEELYLVLRIALLRNTSGTIDPSDLDLRD